MKKFFNFIVRTFKEEFVETWKGFTKETIKPITLILTLLNVVCLLISNIIAVKTVPLFMIDPAAGLAVALPAAIILFPLVLIISDLLAQIDYVWTRRSCHLGFILNLFMVLAFTAAISMKGIVNNTPDQGSFGTMGAVLGSTWFILVASLASFYIGDLINDKIFKRMRAKQGDTTKALFSRCVLSTLAGQALDSTIFLSLGMNILPKLVLGFSFMSWAQVGLAIACQIIVKVLYEIALSPLIIKLCKKFTFKNSCPTC